MDKYELFFGVFLSLEINARSEEEAVTEGNNILCLKLDEISKKYDVDIHCVDILDGKGE